MKTVSDEIVISGIAGRFPNTNNMKELANNLYNKVDMVDDDESRWKHFHPEVPTRAGKIRNIEKFDASFFATLNKHANWTDPQMRMLLEHCYEAILDAGVSPQSLFGTKTGVFIGCSMSDSRDAFFNHIPTKEGYTIVGNCNFYLSNRVSYALGLCGPSFTVDTACSSSAYALDAAYKYIMNGDCDAAIVGGSCLILSAEATVGFNRIGVLAKDGICRPFDENASGFVRSETVSALFLQKKKDANRVYASVIYTKTNNDGFKKEGSSLPSRVMQQKLMEEFYSDINFDPSQIHFVEAHATGTRLGDPQEAAALDEVFCKNRKDPLYVGSIKGNMGHSEAAAGVASMAKIILAFENNKIPPNINITSPRSDVEAFNEGRMKVVMDIEELKGNYIAMNSFGLGGANAHILFKSNPKKKKVIRGDINNDTMPILVTWSGRTEAAVDAIFEDLQQRPIDPEYVALLHSAMKQTTPVNFYRGYGIFSNDPSSGNAICLRKDVTHFNDEKRPLVWVFSGIGSQWNTMGASLMNIPMFADTIDCCHDILLKKGVNLKEIITTSDKTVFDNVLNSYVGIISIEIALTNILRAVGLEPDFIIGHSLGELGVAYADGCLTVEETILAAYARGESCNECGDIIEGAMAAIGMNFKEVNAILPADIDIACHNGVDSTTVSGPADSVRSFVEYLKNANVFAREVACSGIPLHSRYIRKMGEKLYKKLSEVIKNPKKRSSKWFSSSYPESQWSSEEAGSVSAEYFTRNLLNPVYFEEVCKMLPETSLMIEVAPHGLFKAILKKNLRDGDHLSLTKRDSVGVLFLLEAMGQIFQKGVDIDIAKLYPAVEFPVSCGTPMISPNIKWNHTENYLVPYFDTFSSYERRKIVINLNDKSFDFINGHIVDGRVLFPATGWIFLVWETFCMMNGVLLEEQAVVLDDIKLMRATMLAKNQDVFVSINIQKGDGRFEILEGTSTIATGYIKSGNNVKMTEIPKPEDNKDAVVIKEEEFFQEMRIRGYFHRGIFRGVKEIRDDCLTAKVKWNQNWITFMDSMTFCDVSTSGKRQLLVPTDIRKMIINPKLHLQTVGKEKQDGEVLVDVTVCPCMKIIKSGGVEIHEKRNTTLTRRRPREPLLETHKFVPYFASNSVSKHDAMKICTQMLLETSPRQQLVSVEVDATGKIVREAISQYVVNAVNDIPTVISECNLLSSRNIEQENVIVDESKELSSFSNVDMVIGNELIEDAFSLETAINAINENGLIISRECKEVTPSNSLCQLISRIPVDTDDILHIMKLKKFQQQPAKIIQITSNVSDWLQPLQDALTDRKAVVVAYSYQDSNSGILGFINCLRREPNGEKLRCFFIDDKTAPKFNLESPFFKKQFDFGHIINVFKDGQWGGYRHLRLNECPSLIPRNDHVFANSLVKGDLSSVLWLRGHLNMQNLKIAPEKLIKIQIASLNFKDVMLALGTLEQQSVLGFEFSGIDGNGRRVMGISRQGGGLATYYDSSDPILWDIPDKWSFEEAATVPLVYFTVYFAFFAAAKIQKGKSILIHAGSGGVGLAAIQVAFAYGLEVFTTVSTDEKKSFLLGKFPQLRVENIGNSRDTTFEKMIQMRTKGKGVDYVLNSLSGDKLQASIRCLGMNGTFLEIGQYDIVNRTQIHMGHLSRRIHFRAVFFEDLPTESDEMMLTHTLVSRDIKAGIIKPLRTTIFEAQDIESAFRLMASGKHMGKVLLKIRDSDNDHVSLPIKVQPRVCCDPEETYVIVGGLGGFGMELADWLISRGCRKVVLSSRRGISNSYQLSRISNWKTSGATTVVSRADASSVEGCKELLKEALKMGPVGGIFNLAVVLKDAIFENQTVESFEESLKPKVEATKHLSEFSQIYCPDLKHFVTFSSVACGRGNAGQTNYGLANSVMERIIEGRVKRGLPGKSIQWGAVGDVGLLAELQVNDADLEIDGTLPQDLRSCLDVLDTLMTSAEPVVSSMVIGDKQKAVASKGNIIDTILKIMALRDRKLISMYATLARLGIDSLMGVEIRQILDRDYNIAISSQELRSMSLKQLENKVASKASNNIESTQQLNLPVEIQFLSTGFGDESKCNETILKVNNTTTKGTKILMIPGFLGVGGELFSKLVEDLGYPAYVLQIFKSAECTEIEEVIDSIIDDVRKLAEGTDRFFIVAHSFGSLLALKIAYILESEGKSAEIALIDGSPDFMYKISHQMICDSGNDETLRERILKNCITILFMEASDVIIPKVFERPSWDGRVELLHEFMADRVKYSAMYFKKLLLIGMMARLKMCLKVDEMRTHILTSTPITLFKSSETAMIPMDEDLGLKKFTENRFNVNVVNGDHITILRNPKLLQSLKDLVN